LRSTLASSGFGTPTTWYDDDGNLRGLATQATGSTRLAPQRSRRTKATPASPRTSATQMPAQAT
jgi:hypothetical protein